MCVIAICENGTKLDRPTFGKCFDHNDHGAGFAWIEGGKLKFIKGFMTEKIAWKVYSRICDFPHVAHFRLTSAGETCKELTHPFIISDDSPNTLFSTNVHETENVEGLLFHNGTISNWKILSTMVEGVKKRENTGRLSDTRVMAMAVSLAGHSILNEDGGKYVIATENGFEKFGTPWSEKDGIWFSNLFFSYTQTFYNVGNYGKDWWKDKKTRVWSKDKDGNVVSNDIEDISSSNMTNAEEMEKIYDKYYYGRGGL
jgi:hypothetical protein